MPYQHDVFVSYTRDDEAWATKLKDDLETSLKIFQDVEGLRAGDSWEPKLSEALANSQHLVVIWSNKAKESAWVPREIAEFSTNAKDTPDRKLLFLILDGTNPPHPSIQMLQELRKRKAYTVDPGAIVDGHELFPVWNDELKKLRDAIASLDSRIPIPCTVIAMTAHEAAELTGSEEIGMVPWKLMDVLNTHQFGTLAEFQARYGPHRNAWKPFHGALTVDSLFDNVITIINAKCAPLGLQFKWDWIDFLPKNGVKDPEEFDVAQAAVRRLSGDMALVVIDPLSLYHQHVRGWAPLVKTCFDQEAVVVLTLTPFELPPAQAALRDLVRRALAPDFDFYYEPPVPVNRHLPMCGLNLGDLADVQRIVRARVGQHRCMKRTEDSHPMLSYQGKGP